MFNKREDSLEIEMVASPDAGNRVAATSSMPLTVAAAHAAEEMDLRVPTAASCDSSPRNSPRVNYSTAPRLGFPLSKSTEMRVLEINAQSTAAAADRAMESYYPNLRSDQLLTGASPGAVEEMRQLTLRRGIPRSLRPVMWLTVTGVAVKLDENEGFCEKLLDLHRSAGTDAIREIATDLERTFPGHPYFADGGGQGVRKLSDVLHALWWRNPLVRYCQSLNFITGFLLLVFDDVERCFWTALHVLEELLPNDFYSETVAGAKVEQSVLTALVALRLPKLFKHLEAVGYDVGVLVQSWVMPLFINSFPPDTVLSMWDYMLMRTPPGMRMTAHLELILAVLKMAEPELCRLEEYSDVVVFLSTFASRLFNVSALIGATAKLVVTPDALHGLRRKARPQVLLEIQRREERRNAQRQRMEASNAAP